MASLATRPLSGPNQRRFPVVALATAIVVAWPVTARQAGTPIEPSPHSLFDDGRIVDVLLTFTADEFDGLQPRGIGSGWFGDYGEPGGRVRLLGPEGHRNGLTSGYLGLEFPYVHADALIDNQPFTDVGVRLKGNGTFLLGARVGKISLKIGLNQFVTGQKFDAIKTINLHSNVTDASYMNEVLAFRLFREAGVLAPRTTYARVFVTVADRYDRAYYGLFSLVENPDEPFVEARGLPPTGAIFKPVTRALFRDLGKDWSRYNQIYDPKTDVTSDQTQRVIDFARIVSHANDETFAREVEHYLDLDACARFLAVDVWLSNLDGILDSGQNYYLYLDPRTDTFQFGAWDQDHSFGQFFRLTQDRRERLDILRPWNGENRFLSRLFKVEAFRTRYLDHLRTFSQSILMPDRIAGLVDELAELIRPSVADESAERLKRLEDAVAGRRPAVDDQMFIDANTPIKPFVRARAESVSEQLRRLE